MNARKIHYKIGKNVRDVICKNGGTIPEKSLHKKKSLKELKTDNKKHVSNNRK
jgi:hypothetical protein